MSRQLNTQILSQCRFFSNQLKHQKKFFNSLHCVDPQLAFAKNEVFHDSYVERIYYPLKNCAYIKDTLVETIDDIIKNSINNGLGYGKNFIAKQLEITKQLVFVRDKTTHKITHYLRHDTYPALPGHPCGLAMFKTSTAPASKIVNDLTRKILLEELEERRNESENNPSMVLLLRTYNPKAYQMRQRLSDKVYPNIIKFKHELDEYLNTFVEKIRQNENFHASFLQLIKDKVILINSNSENFIQDKMLVNTLLAHKNIFTFNLKKMRLLKDKDYRKDSIINELYNNIKQLYKNTAPSKYQELLDRMMHHYYPLDAERDLEIYAIRKSAPNLATARNLEISNNEIIDDFFSGFSDRTDGDVMLFCTEINYKELKHQYEMKQEITKTFNF